MSMKDIKTAGDVTSLVSEGVNPNEPVFILRGQDKLASATIRHWIGLAKAANVDEDIIESAIQQALRMELWPVQKRPSDSGYEELVVQVHTRKIE